VRNVGNVGDPRFPLRETSVANDDEYASLDSTSCVADSMGVRLAKKARGSPQHEERRTPGLVKGGRQIFFRKKPMIKNRLLSVSYAAPLVALVAAACSVFQPPVSHDTSGAKTGGSSNGSGGADGGVHVTTNGGAGGTAQHEAGAETGGKGMGGSGGSGGGGGGSASLDASTEGGVSGPTGPWWPHKTADGCESAGMPTANDRVKSDPGATISPIYLAMNRFRIGAVDESPVPNNPGLTYLTPDPNAWKSIGMDIDGVCTRSATCEVNDKLVDDRACANSQTVPFDGNDCIDNSIGNIFNIAATAPSIGKWFGLSENDWNCEMWRGGFSNVFKISNYNGQYNDDSVTLDLYTSTGLQTLPQWSCRTTIDQPLATDWYTHAPWIQKEHWIISQDSISLSADPEGTEVPDSKWQDPAAYVRGGWLVAQFPDASWLWFDGERTPVPGFREIIHRGVVAFQLVQDPQSGLWSMQNGTLAFVATPNEMLEGFSQLGFCANMCGTFATVKDYLNTYQDSLSTSSPAPNTTACNALSYGMVFRGAQISADASDVTQTQPFTTCPQPRHPDAPRQGCTCSSDGSTCTLADAGK